MCLCIVLNDITKSSLRCLDKIIEIFSFFIRLSVFMHCIHNITTDWKIEFIIHIYIQTISIIIILLWHSLVDLWSAFVGTYFG